MEQNGPSDLARVLELVHQRGALGRAETEDLQRVVGESEEGFQFQIADIFSAANKELALGRVDLVTE